MVEEVKTQINTEAANTNSEENQPNEMDIFKQKIAKLTEMR